jgi:tetratricopeptide (TPR) repeat protein
MLRVGIVLLACITGTLPVWADPRADCFAKNGRAAIEACTLAIKRNPNDSVSYINRAFEYFQQEEYERSVADYSKAIELDPARADAFQGRAWAYLRMGKADLALADIERSLRINPDNPHALDARGHINEALGRKQEAIGDYQRALRIEPRMQGSKEGLKRLGTTP